MSSPSNPSANAPDQKKDSQNTNLHAARNSEFRRHAQYTGRHTRFVSVMKWLLPITAIVLIAIAFVIPGLQGEDDTISLEYLKISESDQKLTMTKPRFLSSDKGNQNYMVTADSATQKTTDDKRIELINMQADITLKNGQWISVSAPKGWLNPDTEVLDLTGGVEIFSDNGNQIFAKTAQVTLKEKRVTSPDGLQGHGPLGDLKADSFVANQLTGTLKFVGNVKMTLYP